MVPDRPSIDVGSLLSASVATVRENPRPFLVYFAIFIPLAALGSALNPGLWLGPSLAFNGPIGIAYLVASLAGQYLLFESLVDGPEMDWSDRLLRIFGFGVLAFLAFAGVFLATGMLFFVPGLLLGGRWLVSPGMFIAGRRDPTQALGDSWRATRGNTINFAVAIFVVFLGALIAGSLVAAPLRAVFDLDRDSVLAVNAMAMQVVPVCFVALSATAYRLLTAEPGAANWTIPKPVQPRPHPRNNLS